MIVPLISLSAVAVTFVSLAARDYSLAKTVQCANPESFKKSLTSIINELFPLSKFTALTRVKAAAGLVNLNTLKTT